MSAYAFTPHIAEVTVKPKIRVHMRNATGLDEAGIDGGGIFREFLWELLRTGFDPNRALFRYTASDDVMFYPNPQAPSVMPDFKKHFFFLGRMLGKVGIHTDVDSFRNFSSLSQYV